MEKNGFPLCIIMIRGEMERKKREAGRKKGEVLKVKLGVGFGKLDLSSWNLEA